MNLWCFSDSFPRQTFTVLSRGSHGWQRFVDSVLEVQDCACPPSLLVYPHSQPDVLHGHCEFDSPSVSLFLFEGCVLRVPNVRFRLPVMTSCIAFFLCLIYVLSYDLVQVKSSGCCCGYSIPFHGSEDALLYGLHVFFLNSCHHGHSDGCVFLTTAITSQKAGVCLFWLWFSPNVSSNLVCNDPVNHSLLMPECDHPQWSHTTRDQVQCSELQSGLPFSHTPSANSSSYPYFTWPFWSVSIKTWFLFVCMSRVVSDPLLLSTLSHMQRGPGTVDAMGPYVGISWPGSSASCQFV